MTDTTHAAIDAMVAPLRRIAFWLPALWPDRMANMIQALAAERDAALRELDNALALNAALAEANEALGRAAYLATARAEKAETEAAALRKEVEQLREALSDPIAVHANMLRGAIAMPSVENIIHIYGAEALRAALTSKGGEG